MTYTTSKNHWAIYTIIDPQGTEQHHAIVIGTKDKADRIAAQLSKTGGMLRCFHVKEADILDD